MSWIIRFVWVCYTFQLTNNEAVIPCQMASQWERFAPKDHVWSPSSPVDSLFNPRVFQRTSAALTSALAARVCCLCPAPPDQATRIRPSLEARNASPALLTPTIIRADIMSPETPQRSPTHAWKHSRTVLRANTSAVVQLNSVDSTPKCVPSRHSHHGIVGNVVGEMCKILTTQVQMTSQKTSNLTTFRDQRVKWLYLKKIKELINWSEVCRGHLPSTTAKTCNLSYHPQPRQVTLPTLIFLQHKAARWALGKQR